MTVRFKVWAQVERIDDDAGDAGFDNVSDEVPIGVFDTWDKAKDYLTEMSIDGWGPEHMTTHKRRSDYD